MKYVYVMLTAEGPQVFSNLGLAVRTQAALIAAGQPFAAITTVFVQSVKDVSKAAA